MAVAALGLELFQATSPGNTTMVDGACGAWAEMKVQRSGGVAEEWRGCKGVRVVQQSGSAEGWGQSKGVGGGGEVQRGVEGVQRGGK